MDLVSIWTVSSYDRPIILPSLEYMEPMQLTAALDKHMDRVQSTGRVNSLDLRVGGGGGGETQG